MQRTFQYLSEQEANIEILKDLANIIKSQVSSHDGILVDDWVSNLDRKAVDCKAKIERSLNNYQKIVIEYDNVIRKLEEMCDWQKNTLATVDSMEPIGSKPSDVQLVLDALDTIETKILEKKQEVSQIGDSPIFLELGSSERAMIQQRLDNQSSQHNNLILNVTDKKRQLSNAVSYLKGFQTEFKSFEDWLSNSRGLLLKVRNPFSINDQAEEIKTILNDIEDHKIHFEKLQRDINSILPQCSSDQKEDLLIQIQNMSDNYNEIRNMAEESTIENKKSQNSLKSILGDVDAVRNWLSETKLNLRPSSNEGNSQGSLESDKQYHDNLLRTADEMLNALDSIRNRATEISGPHKFDLLENIGNEYENVEHLKADLEQRKADIERALHAHCQTESKISNIQQSFMAKLNELTKLSKASIGPSQESARRLYVQVERLEKEIRDYESEVKETILSLSDISRANNPRIEQEMTKLVKLNSDVKNACDQLLSKFKNAAALRRAYAEQRGEIESVIDQMHQQIQAVEYEGVPVHTKLDRYEAVLETIAAKDPQLVVLHDRGEQIKADGTVADKDVIASQMETLHKRMSDLKNEAEERGRAVRFVISERQARDQALSDDITWLEEKLKRLKKQDSLPIDLAETIAEREVFEKRVNEIERRLDEVVSKGQIQKKHFEKLNELVPLDIQDKLEEIEIFQKDLFDCIVERRKTLDNACLLRKSFEEIFANIRDWVRQSEAIVRSFNSTLETVRLIIKEETSKELEIKSLREIGSQLTASLDLNDSQTVNEMVEGMFERIESVVENAKEKERQLESDKKSNKNFHELLEQVKSLNKEWENKIYSIPTVSSNSFDHIKQLTTDWQENIKTLTHQNHLIERLKDSASSVKPHLDENEWEAYLQACQDWKKLVDYAEEAKEQNEYVVAAWRDVNDQSEVIKSSLKEIDSIVKQEVNDLPSNELTERFYKVKQAERYILSMEPKLSDLIDTSQSLIKRLPEDDKARSSIENRSEDVLDSFSEMKRRVKENLYTLDSLLKERDDIKTALYSAKQSLDTTQLKLHQLSMSRGLNPEEKLLRQKNLETEIREKMKNFKNVIQASKLPLELSEEAEKMEIKFLEVCKSIEHSQNDLKDVQTVQTEFENKFQVVKNWLDDKSKLLAQPSNKIYQTIDSLESLLSEFPKFANELAQLQSKSNILLKSASPLAKLPLERSMEDIHNRWKALKAAAEKQMKDALETKDAYESSEKIAEDFEEWLTNVENSTTPLDDWKNPSEIQNKAVQVKRAIVEVSNRSEDIQQLQLALEKLQRQPQSLDVVERLQNVEKKYSVLQMTLPEKLSAIESWKDCQRDVTSVQTALEDLQKSISKDISEDTPIVDKLKLKQNQLIEVNKQLDALSIAQRKERDARSKMRCDNPSPLCGPILDELKELKDQLNQDCRTLRSESTKEVAKSREIDDLKTKLAQAEATLRKKTSGSATGPKSLDDIRKEIAETQVSAFFLVFKTAFLTCLVFVFVWHEASLFLISLT